jgi:hypothetical protein
MVRNFLPPIVYMKYSVDQALLQTRVTSHQVLTLIIMD